MKKDPTAPNRNTSRLNLREINRDEHSQFKAQCAKRGRSMKGMFVAFMREVINPGDGTGKDGYPVRLFNIEKLSARHQDPK